MKKLPSWREYPREWVVWSAPDQMNYLWEIRFKRVLDRGKSRGLCHFPDRVIEIAITQDRADLLHTFIHEVIHAIEFENKLSIDHDTVHRLEAPLFELVRRYGFHSK